MEILGKEYIMPERSIFDRFDKLEAQNQEIIDLLKEINHNKPVMAEAPKKTPFIEKPVQEPIVNSEQVIKNFLRRAAKEYVWFGAENEFEKAKRLSSIACVALLIIGFVATIASSVALNMYGTFSLFENIWMICTCFVLAYTRKAQKRMLDSELANNNVCTYVQDADGMWVNTNEEKKRFKVLRIFSYIAALANIACLWFIAPGGAAVFATIMEVLFIGAALAVHFTEANLFSMYNTFVVFTGMNDTNTKTVTFIGDLMSKKLYIYDDFVKGKPDYLKKMFLRGD